MIYFLYFVDLRQCGRKNIFIKKLLLFCLYLCNKLPYLDVMDSPLNSRKQFGFF